MFDEDDINIQRLNKAFTDYINHGLHFFASEEEFLDLIIYYSYNADKKMLEKAIEVSLNFYPSSDVLWYQKGTYSYDQGNYIKALSCFLNSFKLNPAFSNALIYIVILYAKFKNFAKANQYFQNLKESFKDVDEIDFLSFLYIRDIQKEIFDQYSPLEMFNPEIKRDASFIFLIDTYCDLLHFIEENVDDYTKHLLYEGLAICYASRNEYQKAHHYLKKAIQIEPQIDDFWIFQAILYVKQNQQDKAIKSMEYYNALNYQNNTAFEYDLARLYYLIGQYDKAVDYITYIINNSLMSGWSFYSQASAYYAMDDQIDSAIDCLEKALEYDDAPDYIKLDLAALYLDTMQLEQANELLISMEKEFADDVEYNFLKAKYCLEKNSLKEGLEHINKALEFKQKEMDFIILKADLYEKAKLFDEAIAYLKGVLKRGTLNPIPLYLKLAGLYMLKNEQETASIYLNLSLHKGDAELEDFIDLFLDTNVYNQLKALLNLQGNNKN